MVVFTSRCYLVAALLFWSLPIVFAQTISGELKQWHKITFAFNGPATSETATPNPFADYALEVTFTNGSSTYVVPGYYAADGNAAETSATSGNQWHVHFAPDQTGTWNYTVSFKTGTDVAVNGGGTTANFMDGTNGTFTLAATDKTGRDHRGKGRLNYVNEHYLQYAGTNEWFVKAGADAPENTLAYEDFDDVPNVGNRRKNWQPHAQDYNAADAAAYTWQNGKGTELLGVVNYLSGKGVNAFSFLTFNVEGDDKNVFPHLYDGDISNYNSSNTWSSDNDLIHDRFDVSRLAQWERIFSYADLKGMYLHFKLQETENDDLMDGGDVDRERKLYFRELIARFSHHLALNWNMGEENVQSTQQRQDMATYFDQVDPYDHLRVLHTYPGQKNSVYTPLLGSASAYTGLSMQTSNGNQQQTFPETEEWVSKSAIAGKKWVIAVDEPGSASIGVDSDPDDRKLTRHRVVWGNFMAGGAGTEFYYGYQSGCGDLNCQDHRSRDQKYTDAAFALHFFQTHFQPYLPNVTNLTSVTTDGQDYELGNPGNVYAIYRPDGGTTAISLPSGTWEVQWYNPRDGSISTASVISGGNLAAPDNNDWTALILPGNCTDGAACDDNDPCTTGDTLDTDCNCSGTETDSDNDGICDAEDNCPNFDNNLIGSACDDNDATTTNDVYGADCNCAGTPLGAITDFWLEAECGSYGSSWVPATSVTASGGSYLTATGTENFYNNPPLGTEHALRFRVAIPVAGDYKIYARTYSTEDGDDSFWVRSGCGNWNSWNRINYPYSITDFAWSQAGNWTSGTSYTPVTFALEKGVNLIEFVYREPNTQLDKLFITLDGDIPTSQGAAAGNCNPICIPGASCDDGDPLTDFDTFDDSCICAGRTPNCAALPVSWGAFTAVKDGQDVQLNWSTEGEENSLDFKVAVSIVRSNFRELASIPAAGTTQETQTYAYRHRNPGSGTFYYQIIQTDYGGNQQLSPIRAVDLGNDTPVAYPNPATETIWLTGIASDTQIQLSDLNGRVVAEQFADPINTRFDLSRLPTGVYIIRAGGWYQKIIVQ